MPTHGTYVTLLEQLIAAPGSVDGWQQFLSRRCDALHGSAASFIAIDSRALESRITVTARTSPEALTLYGTHWHQFDPWALGMTASPPAPNTVLRGEALIRPGELKRTAFYNDFGRRHDISQCLAGIIEVSPDPFSCVSIDRSDAAPGFTAREEQLLSRLLPHLQQALRVHHRLAGADLAAGQLGDVLDRIASGVLLLSSSGRVEFANRAAEDMLAARDGVWLDHGELRAGTSAATTALRDAIGQAVCVGEGSSRPPVLLPRAGLRRALVAVVTPVARSLTSLEPDIRTVAIFLTDPERSPVPDVDFLRSTLHLTVAEARLVRCLIRGQTVEEAAGELRIQESTARTRLKTVLSKTDAHRQVDLVRLATAGFFG